MTHCDVESCSSLCLYRSPIAGRHECQPQLDAECSEVELVWNLVWSWVQKEVKLRSLWRLSLPAAAVPRGVSLKMNGKRCVFVVAPELVVYFLITNGQSGPFEELFVLAKAYVLWNKQTNHNIIIFDYCQQGLCNVLLNCCIKWEGIRGSAVMLNIIIVCRGY